MPDESKTQSPRYYDLKCRRCGHVQQKEFKDNLPDRAYHAYMKELMLTPIPADCSPCGKRTVQDIVAY